MKKLLSAALAIVMTSLVLAFPISASAASADAEASVSDLVMKNRTSWNTSNWDYTDVVFLDVDFDGQPEMVTENQEPLVMASVQVLNADTTKNKLQGSDKVGMSSGVLSDSDSIHLYYDEKAAEYFYIFNYTHYRNGVSWTVYHKLSNDMEFTDLFSVYTYPDRSKIIYAVFGEDGSKQEVSQAQYESAFSDFYSKLTEVTFTSKTVTINRTDSYDTARSKIKSSYEAFGYNKISSPTGLTIQDVTRIQKHAAKIITLSDEEISFYDRDKDGTLTIFDATHIQKIIAKILPDE